MERKEGLIADHNGGAAAKLLKVIACEIAVREFCHVAAQSRNIIDFEFLTQGHHDTPNTGRTDIQNRINAVPPGKYDGIVLGYALCSNILVGLTTAHTPLIIPRAHDCISFFLGSKERYQQHFEANPGTYYYSSGWLECIRRRRHDLSASSNMFLPAHSQSGVSAAYEGWVKKYGEEKARYLMEVMGDWTTNYTHGALIDFDFTKPLGLREQVQKICADRGWQYSEIQGDLGLFRRLVDGEWNDNEVLVLQPGEEVVAVFDGRIIGAKKHEPKSASA